MEKWWMLTACASLPDKVRTETPRRNSSAMLLYVFSLRPRRPIVEEKTGSLTVGLFRRSIKDHTRTTCMYSNVVVIVIVFYSSNKLREPSSCAEEEFCWKIHYFLRYIFQVKMCNGCVQKEYPDRVN